MFAKPTVKYLCEDYGGGDKRYFKQEFLMEFERWGAKRPITERTYLKRKSDGFKCEVRHLRKTLAVIIPFPTERYATCDYEEGLQWNFHH